MENLALIRQSLHHQNHAVFACQGHPEKIWLDCIQHEFPHARVDWLIEKNATTQQDEIAFQTSNPWGFSLYAYSEKQYFYLFPQKSMSLCWELLPTQENFKIICLNHFVLPEKNATSLKAYFRQPEPFSMDRNRQPENVLIIGAGIAGASTAYALARRGIRVTVLEANTIASAGSGNRQGLLYAKISAYNTLQTQLLLASYGFSRSLLTGFLDEKHWSPCGVLHLNDHDQETQRNQLLAKEKTPLWRWVSQEEASHIAGIPLPYSGLFWQYGAWIHPPALTRRLLSHPNITVLENHPIENVQYDGKLWHAISSHQQDFSGCHLVLCTGAQRHLTQLFGIQTASIRGQTDNIAATDFSGSLKTALSGKSYISPAWENAHCFGAIFRPNNDDDQIYQEDTQENCQALQQLHSQLGENLCKTQTVLSSHAAVRCDAFDHLPLVGAVGDVLAMRQVYAALGLDKNYRIQADCPYIPNLYVNIAHGSRGLCTAPFCGEAIAADITQTLSPLPHNLRAALSPNRLFIRDIVRHRI